MIQVGTIWTYVFAPDFKNNFTGKWIYEADADFFREISPQLDELAADGVIHMAKFANKNPDRDPCPYIENSVLCVYTWEPRDEKIRRMIQERLNLWTDTYKTEEQTTMEWQPGGKLYEDYISYWRNKRGTL